MRNVYILKLIIILISSQLIGQKLPTKQNVKAFQVKEEIILDGNLNEQIWKNIAVSNFTQKDPDEGKPESEQTKVWVGFDNENFYVGAKLYDSQPDSIDNSLLRRDNFDRSDWFYVAVDTYNDDQNGYYFAVNPAGSIGDGTFFNDSWDDDSWNGVWQAATKIDTDGWNVEMKIPFSQLRFKESSEMIWGINFARDIKRKNESSYYIMVPKDESGFVSKFVDLIGLDNIELKQRFEILPYIVQKAQYLKHDSADPFYKSNQYKTAIGADLKIGLGSNFNIDATINPDFGQVEVDPAVVNLSAFETYYDEKRPFFIEGNNLFYFGVGGVNNNWGFNFGTPELFYTRRIGRAPQGDIPDNDYADYPRETRILGAAKLTGKIDESWSVGVVNAVTERTYATISDNYKQTEVEVEPLTNYSVIRTQKQFNKDRQSLGFMFTSVNRDLNSENLNESLSKQAYTFGIDSWTYLDTAKVYALAGYIVGSYTSGSEEYMQKLQERPYRYFQRPDATSSILDSNKTSIGGYYTRLMLNKQEGNFYINTAIGAVSPGFENSDLGFQWMADKINGHLVLGYRWYEPDDFFRRKSVYLAHFRDYDYEGNNLNNGIMLYTNLQFMNYYSFYAQGFLNTEEYTKTLTRGGPLAKNPAQQSIYLGINSDSRKNVIFGIDAGLYHDELGGYNQEIGFDVEWKPSSQVTFSIGPNYEISHSKRQWINAFEDQFATATFGKRYVFGEFEQKTLSASIRLNWIITPMMSLQLYMQPLFAVGEYNKFKELARPSSLDYNSFANVSYNDNDEEYTIDPDGNGPAESFTFSDPNFNYKSLRGTIVFRWEVLPGSIFYLVWSQDRDNFNNPGEFNFNRDFSDLVDSESNNIFLAKFSYWLDL